MPGRFVPPSLVFHSKLAARRATVARIVPRVPAIELASIAARLEADSSRLARILGRNSPVTQASANLWLAVRHELETLRSSH